MKVLVVGAQEVAALLPVAACIPLMEETLRLLATGDAVLPLRQVMWQPDRTGVLALMPAYLGTPQAIGAKVITVFPANQHTVYDSHQGCILLFECEHGRLLAMVDAGSVTAIRTAAVSAVATKYLARSDASDLAILGSGTQAAMHLEALLAVRPIARVRVWSRTPDHARRFVERAAKQHALTISAMENAQEAVQGAQIICTTTAAREPILQGAWLSPGAHINAIGASTPGFRELDSSAVAQSSLFVDRRESAINEADDVRIPKQEGMIDDGHIRGELGAVVLGRVAGRTGADQITIFKSLGLAVEDLAAAHAVYTQASAQGLGTWVEFGGERHS
ncbi:MAG TPA: ornithine cyclodeaminase family protein [Chloroflexota bacterium]|nr:ornithine cyclodeaminase family protein [Chloroflexota bacterium]